MPTSDILANDSNLSVSSYVEQEDTREVINIKEVNATLQTLIAEGNELNQRIDEIIKDVVLVELIFSTSNSTMKVPHEDFDLEYSVTSINIGYKFTI